MNGLDSVIADLERQRAAIDSALDALRGIDGMTAKRGPGRPKKVGVKKRGISAEGRQRQIEAMRRYWATKKAGAKKAVARKATKKAASNEA